MNVLEKLQKFYLDYKGEKGYIGSTVKGKLIPYFKVSKTRAPIIIAQYAIHAREYITTYLALEQIKQFEKKGRVGTVYFIPAVNLDGIDISLNQAPLFKANANGVDLNVNFDALWGKGEKNVKMRGAENCIGEFAFSEPESQSLRNFTLEVKPDFTISYHSKGEEVYYGFNNKESSVDYSLAKTVAGVTGYALKTTPNSCGGYKDWCVDKLGISAITIEVGSDSLAHPIQEENLREIYLKNEWVICALTQMLWEKNAKKIY